MSSMPTDAASKPDATPGDPPSPRPRSPEAERALAEAAARRAAADRRAGDAPPPAETGGRSGPEPVRYGDWEVKGIASDF
jgi:hypothetical protein